MRTIAVATVSLLCCVTWPWLTSSLDCGDLTKKITISGEMLSLVNTINDMIDQLVIFAAEVKVAREVGTEGKLGSKPRLVMYKAHGKKLREFFLSDAKRVLTLVPY